MLNPYYGDNIIVGTVYNNEFNWYMNQFHNA